MSSARASIELLTFDLGRQRFGLPLAAVREVVRAVSIARLPKAPDIVEGVIDLRGKVVAVLDIRARFRLAAKPISPSDHFIIADAQARLVALRVDRAVALVTVSADVVDDVATLAPTAEHVVGAAKLPEGLVLIHDVAAFLSAAEAAALAAAEA